MANTDSGKRISDTAATVWAYVQNWAARGITLIVFFGLARLLTPAEFGAFAVAMIFLTLGEIFVEQLFGHAIVQRDTLTEAHRSSAFWVTLMIGATLALTTLLAAPAFAAAFDSPGVEPIIMTLTPAFGFMAVSSVPSALLRRALDYRTLARRTALSNLLSGIVAIVAAASGLGVWTFVVQQLVFQAVSTAVLWRHEAWRPQLVFDRKALGELFGFASRITLVKVLDLVETRVLELVIARYLGVVALGHYALASRAQQSATQLLAAPLWESSISVFARRQNDRKSLAAAFEDRVLLAALLIMPAFLLAAASAEALVPAVFGEQWHEAVAPFQILCVLGALRSIAFLFGGILQAVGEADAALSIGFARTAVTLCAIPPLLSFGSAGVGASLLIGQLIVLAFMLRVVFFKLGIGSMKVFRIVAKPVVAACIAALVSLVLLESLEGYLPELALAALGLGVSVLLFAASIIVLMPGVLLKHCARLPASIAARFGPVLRALIRFEDGLRAKAYLVIFASGSGSDFHSSHRRSGDVLLVFGDAYSIVGSVGDQALFGGLITLLRQSGITRARVLCRPAVTLPKVDGIELLPHSVWGSFAQARALAREVANARGFVVVGADVLDGFYSRFESVLRLGIAAFAANRGVPTVLCSFSFNEQPDPATAAAFKKLPSSVKLLCRDSVSRDRLVKLVGEHVQLMADLAYLLEPAKSSELEVNVKNWLVQGHRGTGPVIGWNLSPHSLKLLTHDQRNKAAEASAVVIGRLVSERDVSVVLIPHDFRPHASDPAMLADIFSRIPSHARERVLLATGPYTAVDVKQVCALFDLVLTGRMHLMIAALGRDVPVVAIEYQGKFAGALAHFCLGSSHLLEPAEVCSDEVLYRKVCAHLDDIASTRAQIESRRPLVEALASKAMMECLRGAT
ncbi:oligosaccharide flippase family protein [Aromatoleum evansii]|uniref:oligosaccharide flippase family protein n=1 Tax=Aromatoleum evansii TaxID=59406 RepID=UPI00145E96C5|nr:oligosaccharide flippase family protein [Aromatoleum evansii]NMG29254.1 oligosaccharide flippase family protein [Aromatoleum evansii]